MNCVRRTLSDWILTCTSMTASLLFLVVLFTTAAHAESQRFVDYEYDGAGNIISTRSGVNLAPPDVTNLSPAFVNQDSFVFITATGTNLYNVSVSTSTPGLQIVGVNHVSATEVRFRLIADSNAAVGLSTLEFTTRLGNDVENIVVAERTPVISTDPNPILLEPDNAVKQVTLLFDQPFSTDQVYDVLIQDTSIASTTTGSITLLAGEREVQIDVTGLTAGNTSLEINQFSNFQALAIPVIVADPFQLPPGNQYIASKPFGVTVSHFELPPGSNEILSKPFGVTARNFTLPVGNNLILSEVYGVTLEPVAEQITPSSITRGTTVTLIVTGVSLNTVTEVSFVPGSGITQTSVFSVNPLGTEISVFIDVASNAATGLRQIILDSLGGPIVFSMPNGNILEITN